MSDRTAFDFIVIGAGIGGAGIADALASAGRVALVEMEERPGYHATGRSAALFAPTYGPPIFRALTRASAAFYDAAAEGFTERPVLTDRGVLTIARADQRAAFDTAVAALAPENPALKILSPTEAEAMVPSLRPGYVAAAFFDPGAKDMDVDAILQAYLRRCRRAGVEVFTGARPVSMHRDAGTWRLDLPAGPISAPILVNAAGAWADQVAAAAGAAPVGLRALRRTAALIDPPAQAEIGRWPAVFDVEEEFYIKPDAGKILISPADEEEVAPGDAYPDDLMVAVAVDRVQTAFDIEVRRVNHSWAGLRTFAPDGEPVIGFDSALDGFFWCAGQGGYGIQSSPAFSRLAAALVRGEGVPLDIAAEGVQAAAVSPARFGG